MRLLFLWRSWLLRVNYLAGFKAYEVEDEVTKDLVEFSLANAIFAALVEGHACEQSSRYVIFFFPFIFLF